MHPLRKNSLQQPIHIDTDFFGTHPVLLDRQTFRLGTDFEDLSSQGFELDETSFWDSLIWDMPLGNRTLDKRVEFLPPGSHCSIDLEQRRLSVQPNIQKDPNLANQRPEYIIELLDRRLQEVCNGIVSNLRSEAKLLLPLSGGLDSRLIAVYLKQTSIDPKRIDVVTFATNQSSHEYRLANIVARQLGFGKHYFYEIRRGGYINHSNDFWRLWRGVLSVLHGHLYGFLKEKKDDYALVVSGAFGDAVAGFKSQAPGTTGSFQSTSILRQFQQFDSALSLPEKVRSETIKDLEFLYDDWLHSGFSIEFDEYIYLQHRQPKSFSPLMQTYRRLLPIATPYSDPELINLFLSCPFELRNEKLISRVLLQRRDAALAKLPDVSSSFSSFSVSTRRRRLLSTWFSRASMAMTIFSNDRLRWFNPFATEDIFTAMRCESREAILYVLQRLNKSGIISSSQASFLGRKPLRSTEASRQARLLTYLPWVNKL